MRCFPFSKSETRTSDHRHRFSWKFFSQNNSASDSKKSEKSAPSSSSLSQTKLQGRQTQTAEATVSAEPRRIDDDDDESPSLMQSTSQRPPEPRAFMYEELREATHNFSRVNLLGEGGFGCVYKGLLKHQNPNDPYFSKEVAVKQLNKKGQQGHKEWLTEVHFLGLVEHPNLVKLVGYCAEDDERGIQRLLVYEYMVNGSLEGHLFGKGPSVLSWQERLHIMLGAAHGLAYLHEEINGIQVIFRDFKTSNVLLDKDFTPKLSDFGLARQGPETGASHVSTSVVGTFGYAAPEYVQTGHLTAKSDVWSFGVVLLEMLSGRRSMDRNRPKNEQQLLEWVRPYINVNKKFHYIMDPRLGGKYSLMQAQKVAELALQCLNKYPRTRPIMSVVVEKLKEISEVPESGSPQLDVVSTTSTDSAKVTSRVKEETKESACSKKRRLIFRDVRNRVWAPKVVQV